MKLRQLLDEIQQRRPFLSLQEEAFLELWRTAEYAIRWVSDALKPHGLSIHQYNVLRILRGAEPRGLASGEVAKRMVSRVPDITRLLERLEGRGLIRRKHDRWDRRVVLNRVTPQGIELVARATPDILAAHNRELAGLSEVELHTLVDLLESIRRRREAR